MALTAYLDESGTHGAQSRAVVVAAFAASASRWAAYEAAYSALLSSYGVGILHAKDFRQRSGEFRGWSPAQCATFNSVLLQLSDQHLEFGCCSILRPEDYDLFYRTNLPRKARPDRQYGLCFRMCLLGLVVLVQDGSGDFPINFVIESGHKNQADVMRIYDQLLNDPNMMVF